MQPYVETLRLHFTLVFVPAFQTRILNSAFSASADKKLKLNTRVRQSLDRVCSISIAYGGVKKCLWDDDSNHDWESLNYCTNKVTSWYVALLSWQRKSISNIQPQEAINERCLSSQVALKPFLGKMFSHISSILKTEKLLMYFFPSIIRVEIDYEIIWKHP